MAPPTSAAVAYPYPSTYTSEPNGMTLGSTAITFASGLLFKSTPVDVTPEQPSQFAVYAVAVTEKVCPSGSSWLLEAAESLEADSFDVLVSSADSAFSFVFDSEALS